MKLTGKIIRVDSGSEYKDGKQRAFVQIGDDTGMYGTFRFPNSQGYKLDDLIELELQVKEQVSRAAG